MLKPKDLLIKIVKYIPSLKKKEWDAKECILEMKEQGFRNWKQTDWVGF
jgi:hypothetical protein